jgi:trimeric autotransporter adhesin
LEKADFFVFLNLLITLVFILPSPQLIISPPMKKIYFSLFFSVLLSFVFNTSFSQTITLGSLGTTSFCPSGTLAVPFTSTLPAGTQYNVYLSDFIGSFSYPTLIGTGTTSPINVTFPTSVASGNGYLIKIVSVSPVNTSNFSSALTTNGQAMTISVVKRNGKALEGDYFSLCSNTALTGKIKSNQTGVSYEWQVNGNFQTNVDSLRMVKIPYYNSSTYTATVQKTGCGSVAKTFYIFYGSASAELKREGAEYQCAGGVINFREKYFSDSATYQWKKDGSILMGATKDTLVASQSGVYNVVVSDKCVVSGNSSVTEQNSKVTFGNIIGAGIANSDYNGSTKLCGNNAYIGLTFRNELNNSLNPYSYQWKKNGVNIAGAIANSIFGINTVGIYNLVLTQGNCSVFSNGFNITRGDTVKLTYSFFPTYSGEICVGTQTIVYESFRNGAYIQKDLYKNNVLYRTSISGDVSLIESGNYTVRGTSSGCVVLPSDTIKVIIKNSIKPTIYNSKPLICPGKTGYLSTSVSSGFQWFRNNQPISGAIYQSLYPNQTGFYKVNFISSGCVSGFSDSTLVTVSNLLNKPDFKGINSNTIGICNNNYMTFGLNVVQPNNLVEFDSLFVKRNGIIISKQVRDLPFSLIQPGTYTVVGKQGTCQTESDPVEIKIGEPITANITGSTSIYTGQKVHLNLNFTGGNAWSYQTSDVVAGQTTSLSPTIKIVNPTSTQTYSITSVASNCGVGTVTGNATVTVLPCPNGQTVSLQSGNWNTATTWSCGQIPTSAYDAIIENGHTVNLPNGYQGVTKRLDLRGGLTQGFGAGVSVNR